MHTLKIYYIDLSIFWATKSTFIASAVKSKHVCNMVKKNNVITNNLFFFKSVFYCTCRLKQNEERVREPCV